MPRGSVHGARQTVCRANRRRHLPLLGIAAGTAFGRELAAVARSVRNWRVERDAAAGSLAASTTPLTREVLERVGDSGFAEKPSNGRTMSKQHLRRAVGLIALVSLTTVPVDAHHEAMFGPQSAAVLSPTIFVSAQVFDKEEGKDDQKRRETTTVYSVGFTPLKKQPLSIAFILPVTFASGAGDPSTPGSASRGFEDTLLTARYRLDAQGIASSLGLDQSYVMGVAGLEMPTGTIDHPFGRGAFGEIAAGLFSVEKRPIAAIAYVYYHHRGVYNGLRNSGNTFAGGGIAYTPIDDDATGKLFSLQLGLSYEQTFASEQNGMPVADSGASGIFMHPGIVFSMNPAVQFFGLVSLPLTQQWNSIVDRQRFRLGTGIIWILKHSGT